MVRSYGVPIFGVNKVLICHSCWILLSAMKMFIMKILEVVCHKQQTKLSKLVFWKKKNFISLSSAEFDQRVAMVKMNEYILIFCCHFSQGSQLLWYPEPICPKGCYLNELVKGNFVNCLSGFNIQYYDIFCWKNVSSFCTAKATHIFSAKNFSIFAYHSM